MKLLTTNYIRLNANGFSIIEALIAIAMASIIVVVLGSTVSFMSKAYSASDLKDRALGLARENLDIVSEIQNSAFACLCPPPPPAPRTHCASCTLGSQTCSPLPDYSSCWLPLAIDPVSNSSLHLDSTGGWHLVAGAETLTAPLLDRSIDIQNLNRDANGNINASGAADPNTKQITVTVRWTDKGVTKSASLSTILTAWKSL